MASEEDELKSLEDPVVEAGMTSWELHHGRLGELARHIRRTNFNIHPIVAEKLLHILERQDEALYFELRFVRRSDLPPAQEPLFSLEVRDFEMALAVARLKGFEKRGLARACHEVGPKFGLKERTVRNLVSRYREAALGVLLEEQAEAEAQKLHDLGGGK